MIESPYGCVASRTDDTENIGKMMIGNRAVAEMGAASVTHQVTIQAPSARTTVAL